MKTKKIILAFLSLGIFLCGEVYAQLPTSSTEDAPIWYYIRVIGGSDDLADRVFTMEDGRVYGRPVYSTLNVYQIAKQLWRFEREATVTSIINKATGKKMDIVYDTDLRKRIAIGSDEPSTEWKLLRSGNYYNISVITEPSTGTADNTLAYQSNSQSNRDYIITFEKSTLNTDDNAKFTFVKYEIEAPRTSSSDNEVWYSINTARPDNTDKCITAVPSASGDIKFTIETKNITDENQYWKFVKKDGSDADKYHIINKGTGHIINTDIILNRYFYAQYTDELAESNGWEFISLFSGQYELKGETDTGIIRYLNATSTTDKTNIYSGNTLNTGFAWTFEWIEGEGVSISNPDLAGFYVYSENNRIFVIGTEDYTIRNMYGSSVNKNADLPTGIYLVAAKNGKTTKVLVK